MEQQFSRIAVKVGSNVLTRRDGTLDVTRMSALVLSVNISSLTEIVSFSLTMGITPFSNITVMQFFWLR